MKKIFYTAIIWAFTATNVFAQTNADQNPGGPATHDPRGGASGEIKIEPPYGSGIESFTDLIRIILENIVFPIGSVVAVLYIIYAGFKFVTAQGKPEKLDDAKKTLMYALIGTAILLGAWVITEIIQATIVELGQAADSSR